MDNPFDQWNIKKKAIDSKRRPFFYERQVWFCAHGLNVGSEQNGKGKDFLRPVVIVKKFNYRTFWGIPLTSQSKTGSHYLSMHSGSGRQSIAILHQLRLFDAKRLKYQIGVVPKEIFILLTKNLKDIIP
jgi:mRNA interferase MazF